MLLVQGFDEAILHTATWDLMGAGLREPAAFVGVVLADVQVAGRWRRTVADGGLTVQVAPSVPFGRERTRALHREVDRLATFLGVGPRFVTLGSR